MKVSASYYQDKDPFKDVFLSFSYSKLYDFDYYFLVVQPLSYTDTDHYYLSLYLISDLSESKGAFKFCTTDQYPYNTLLYTDYTLGSFSFKYSGEVFSSYALSSDSSFPLGFYNRGSSLGNGVNGWCFDNYNLDKFPTYQGTSSNYTSKFILASNVDVYNQNGDLLQYGNYYTLLQFFGGKLDASKIKDWSGHETAPGVVVEPTTSGGDSQTSKDQLETSKGIWGTVKDIFHSLADLDKRIAESIKGFFTDLKDGILDGLKALFIPSDNLFDDIVDIVKSKFGFIPQIFDMTDFIIHLNVVDTPPDLSFSFPENYRGNSRLGSFLSGLDFELIDWSVVEPYRQFIRGLIIGLSWYFFIRKLRKRASDVINGTSSGGVS